MKKSIAILIIASFSILFTYAQKGNYNAGKAALSNVTYGDFNVAVGDSTLYSLKSSSYNTAIGYRAGYKVNSSNSKNVFLGFNAGANTIGSDNIFIGFLAGYYAGADNYPGRQNTVIGSSSGFNMSGYARYNTFLGSKAGYSIVDGTNNVFIGDGSGASTSHTQNVNSNGFPYTSQKSKVNASYNTAVGSGSLYYINSGYRNVAIGNYAGRQLEDGYMNTFVGDSTGVDLSNGRYNTFIGTASGARTEYTSGNTFIGFRSGYNNNATNTSDSDTKAQENTYLGLRAGQTNMEGSYNVMLGARSDFTATGDLNMYNVGLGYGVSIGNSSTASKNAIVIGALSKVTANNAIAIGYQTEASIDNTLVLGGNNNENRLSVGIGTITPNTKASLDLGDTDKGFLVNRLTNAQRTSFEANLTSDDAGMLVFDIDDKVLYTWNGAAWSSSTTDSLETRIAALENNANGNSSDKTPQLFNYQTALLNTNQAPLTNTTVSFRISILDDISATSATYQETHSVTTSTGGIANFRIGDGTVVTGDFTTINWATSNYYLKVEVDVNGGTSYVDFGTSQLVSVPYALHARTADRLTTASSSKTASKKKMKQKS